MDIGAAVVSVIVILVCLSLKQEKACRMRRRQQLLANPPKPLRGTVSLASGRCVNVEADGGAIYTMMIADPGNRLDLRVGDRVEFPSASFHEAKDSFDHDEWRPYFVKPYFGDGNPVVEMPRDHIKVLTHRTAVSA